MWYYQVSCVLHWLNSSPSSALRAVPITWLQQAGCLSTVMLCVSISVKSEYKSRILLKLDWGSVISLFSVPQVCTKVLNCSFHAKPLNRRCWGSFCLREGKCCLEDGRKEGKELKLGQFSVCTLPPHPNEWGFESSPDPLHPPSPSLRLAVSHPWAVVAYKA